MNKMGTSKKKNLKIAAATGMAIFSLVSVFVATMAWFATNIDVNGKGMGIKVGDKTGKLDFVAFHKLLSSEEETVNNETITTYHFDVEEEFRITYHWNSNSEHPVSQTGSDAFVMGPYSPLEPKHPFLIVFALNKPYSSVNEGDIFIKGKTDIQHFLGSVVVNPTTGELEPEYPLNHTSAAYIDTFGGHDYYASSSVIQFKSQDFASGWYASVTDENATSIDLISSNLSKDSSAFVTISGDGPDSVSFDSNPFLYKSEANKPTSIQYIAMVADYYPEAISNIYSAYLGNNTLEQTYGGDLYFACDWSLEVF